MRPLPVLLLLIFPPAAFPQDKSLELPPDQEVSASEGFVSLEAKLKKPGDVRFLVVGSEKVKYTAFGTTLIVSVPPTPGAQISVFAVALVDGKLTDFVTSTITVRGPPQPQPPGPNPPPGPTPPQVFGKLHVTVVEDAQARTPETAALLGSQSLRQALTQAGHSFHLLDARDPRVAQLKLNQAFTQTPALIFQTQDGRVVPQGKAFPLPRNEQDFLALVKQVSGL